MATKRFIDFPDASSLTGTEYIPIWQSGSSRKATPAQLAVLGTEGPPGDQGEQGEQGEPGVDGHGITSGTGTPSGGLGTDGDWYLDTATGRLYGPKTAGSWGSGISLIGPPGTDGVDGDGQGVPAGGATGQLLAKNSGTSYDTEWIDSPTGGGPGDPGPGVAAGGTTGQVLAKNSGTDYDTEWVTPSGGGGGGGVSWTLVVDEPGTSLTNFTQQGPGALTVDDGVKIIGAGSPTQIYYNADSMPFMHVVVEADIMLLASNGGNCYAGIGGFDRNDLLNGAPWHGYAPFVRIERVDGTWHVLSGRMGQDVAARTLPGGAVDTWFTVRMHVFGGAADSYVNGTFATPTRGLGEWRADTVLLWAYNADAKWRNIKAWVAAPDLPV